FALEFLIDVLKIPLEKILVAVFKGENEIPADTEAIRFWKENGVSDDKIYLFGKSDNFWGPAGDTGPCGPSTEIYYDYGPENGCGKADCSPACGCGRYLEIWNLVFTQYNYNGKGYSDLPKKNIDTGMGLERIAAVLANKTSVFDTPLFKNITETISKISGLQLKKEGDDAGYNVENNVAIRIIADHVRAIYFLISDGVIPSNEGRGYILRRIIRRTIRFGRKIGIEGYFLNNIGEAVIKKYSGIYPELSEKKDFSFKLVREEEKRFSKTLNEGSKILLQKIKEAGESNKSFLDSVDVFRLYETYGFPVELTEEILRENKLGINKEEFKKLMLKHMEKSKKATGFDKKIDDKAKIYHEKLSGMETDFEGYHKEKITTDVLFLMKSSEEDQLIDVDTLKKGESGQMILKQTPFYGEKGGQIGDRGIITGSKGIFRVKDCRIPAENIYILDGYVENGIIRKNEKVEAGIDIVFRMDISRNHTATHLLHWALRNVLGQEIKQAGSYVGNDRFRFDYSFYGSPSRQNMKKIERLVNEKIQANDIVRSFETTSEYAHEIGAISLFDEKYGKFVRVIEIDGYSRELCGGTHVKRTGDIGIFKIISDTSIGSNLRRIEAATGMHAYDYLTEKEEKLSEISLIFNIEESMLADSLSGIRKELEKKTQDLNGISSEFIQNMIINKFNFNRSDKNLKIIHYNISGIKNSSYIDIKWMGIIGDNLIDYYGGKNIFITLGNVINGRPAMILQCTADLIERGIDCGKLAREAAPLLKGGGGGKPQFAQLGGSETDSLDKALEFAQNKVKKLAGA
ncbi:MAG: alanine--tRNA ligase, partial [Actinobacteria bacterium]|nr:alanine--tRNA ligase [Actinomycetota bacterium]